MKMNKYYFTTKELKTKNVSEFKSKDVIYLKPKKDSEFKYIILLKKETYDNFYLESEILYYDSFKPLNTVVGNKRGMTPEYIYNFLHRR